MMTIILIILGLNGAQAAVEDPCLNTERWTLPSGKNPNWIKEFHEFSSGRSTPIFAWTRALQLKRISQVLTRAELESDFSEYWVGRVLFELKLDPLAHDALRSVFENSENADLRKAAYVCLARIQMRSPDFEAPSFKDASLLSWNESDSDVMLITLFGKKLSIPKSISKSHRALLEGIQSLEAKNYPTAILSFQEFLSSIQMKSGNFLNRYEDMAHLLLGRALYSVARFEEAALQFQKVNKKSNLQIEALNNLAWAYLLNEKYDDAIGVSLQLRAGNLKSTFSPESLMVSAMALNEICNYPDSIRMVQTFVRDYETSFSWLKINLKTANEYVETLAALKGRSSAPTKLVTEWMRSPEFLTRQKEINFLIEQPKKLSEIETKAALEQSKLTTLFITHATQFIRELKIQKLKLKPGQELSSEFSDQYFVLKKELRILSQYYKASKTWKNLARNYEKRIPKLRIALVNRINQDLKVKNDKLLSLLNKIRDNVDLIEVEIYNGASQDLVWKNAHPDFSEEDQSLTEQKSTPDHAKTWSWGRFPASDIDRSEVWEDELGALKADVSNQCAQKEKFLKLGKMMRSL